MTKAELTEMLKENLTMDLDFDESDEKLTVSVFFNDEIIVWETVYLDHNHEKDDL